MPLIDGNPKWDGPDGVPFTNEDETRPDRSLDRAARAARNEADAERVKAEARRREPEYAAQRDKLAHLGVTGQQTVEQVVVAAPRWDVNRPVANQVPPATSPENVKAENALRALFGMAPK